MTFWQHAKDVDDVRGGCEINLPENSADACALGPVSNTKRQKNAHRTTPVAVVSTAK